MKRAHDDHAIPKHLPDEPENPLAQRSTPSSSRRSATSSTAIHDEVFADLGDRDAHYIRRLIAFQRRLAAVGRASC